MSHNINKELKRLKQSVGYLRANTPTEVVVYQLKTILTDAQIKTLPTTPVELIEAPGAGKVLLFHNASLRWNASGGFYSNYDADASLNITYGNGAYASCGDGGSGVPVSGDDNTVGFYPPYTRQDTRPSWSGDCIAGNTQYPVNSFENQPINIAIDNAGGGDLTGGHADNTLEVTVFYSIVDL